MKILACVLLSSAFLPLALAASDHEPAPETHGKEKLCEEAITVFQDVSMMGRKDRAAKNMTQSHEKMARTGWRFADMEVLHENGDLEGFFLSYRRGAPCLLDKGK